MLSLNVRTPVHENNHTSHRVQDPSLIRISQHEGRAERDARVFHRYEISFRGTKKSAEVTGESTNVTVRPLDSIKICL